MRRTTLAAMTMLVFAGTSGCGGARPSKYYMLQLPDAPPTAASPYPVTLLVGHITAPDLLRDDRIIYRIGSEQMGTYEHQRWVERPTEMLEALLVRMLRASGRYRSVERWGSNARGDYILRGRLSRLEEVDENGVLASVELELELFEPKTGTTVWSQIYSHDEPATKKTVPAVVEALNRNVQRGLEQLTATLNQYFDTHPPQ